MKLIRRSSFIYNLINRRRVATLKGCFSTFNVCIGMLLVLFIVILQESQQTESNSESVRINRYSSAIKTIRKQEFKDKDSSDYYLRIDYTIRQVICQPLNAFSTKNAIKSIEKMTVDELNGVLTKNIKVQLSILRINTILKSSEKMTRTKLNRKNQLICSYVLELFVLINFPVYCENDCQKEQLHAITSDKNLFGDLPNSSLKFSLPNTRSTESSNQFYIYNVVIYRSVKYLEKALFIQSAAEIRFVSTELFQANKNDSLVSMSMKDKSLFVMKTGLDILDSSSVYVSFLSLSLPNLYLRHEDGQVKIAKNDQSILFRQDATFKLIFDNTNDVVVFQTINLVENRFIALNNDVEAHLVIRPYKEQPTVDKFDDRFIFKLITAS